MRIPGPVEVIGKRWCRAQCRREDEKRMLKPERVNERPVELAFMFRHLATACPDTILDVGTGKSSLPHLLYNCGHRVTAVDNVRDYWRGGMFNRHFTVQHTDITAPGLDETFDFITCISVIEHIRDHEAAVQVMMSLLNPGGSLIITCPYSENRFADNVYDLPEAGYGQNFQYICRSYSRTELNAWMQASGGHIADQEYWRCFTGELWTFGEQLYPPEQTGPDSPHQLTCLRIVKDS